MIKFSRIFTGSVLFSLSLLLISPVHAATKKTDEELRARAMDQGRTLQSRIRALKKLYSHMLVDGEIPSRNTCVWDVLGTQGPIYSTTIDQQLRLRHYGISMNVMAFKKEQDVVDKLKSGECDTAIMSGAKAREFNDFTGSIEALGGLPTEKHMKLLLQVLSSPQAAKRMQQGNYAIAGIVPVGFNYLYSQEGEGKTPTLKRIMKGKASVLKEDPTHTALFNAYGVKTLNYATTAEAAGAFNLADSNLLMAPLIGYSMFGLGAGVKNGVIVDYPLSQMTLQVVTRLDTIPAEVGQLLREDLFIKLNFMYREVEKNTRDVPMSKLKKLSARDEKAMTKQVASLREKLTKSGAYNPSMMKLQQKIRCKLDASLSECQR